MATARRSGEHIVCDADISTSKVSMIHVGGFTSFIIYETEEVLTNSGMKYLGWLTEFPAWPTCGNLFFGYK